MTLPGTISSSWAFERYETVRSRLPLATFPAQPEYARNLGELSDKFDAFVFDSFGVLNVGDTTIPGARERICALRAGGKQLAVLTNSATVPLAGLVGKYASLGLTFSRCEIISSREVLAGAMQPLASELTWGVAAPAVSDITELPCQCHELADNEHGFENCDGFILLSSQCWNEALQARLLKALAQRPRPLLVGNPDVVAPREDGFSLEPGAYAHSLADRLQIAPAFYGKPFSNAFAEVERRFAPGIDPKRIAMIGDSLHTDILGGAAAGWRTVLVTDFGLPKDIDVDRQIDSSGIVPDFIIPSI